MLQSSYLKKSFLIIIGCLLLIILSYREYKTHKIYNVKGQISSCRYVDAARYCSLFTTDDGAKYILTEGSVDQLKKINEDIANFYNKPIQIEAHILGQKIDVEEIGKLNRIAVVKFQF